MSRRQVNVFWEGASAPPVLSPGCVQCFWGANSSWCTMQCPCLENSRHGPSLQHTRYCIINKNIPCFQECALEEAWISRVGLGDAESQILL